jgi:hypothetical protein
VQPNFRLLEGEFGRIAIVSIIDGTQPQGAGLHRRHAVCFLQSRADNLRKHC